jgi:hypothetical protein
VNDLRRHETQDQAVKRAEQRRERVEQARRSGSSIRSIAEAEGVDPKTIRNDLASSRGEGSPPEIVAGRDGKQYPAQPARILCQRCTRVGATKNCAVCADLNRKPATDKKEGIKKTTASSADHGPVDLVGNEVPKRCRDAFGDPWAIDTLRFIERFSEEFRNKRIADGMKKRAKRLPFYNVEDTVNGVRFVIQYLDQLADHFKQFRPTCVCPSCEGEGCADCRTSGLVPFDVYSALKEAKK